ncbi:hypothetical protein R3P38DRAFT_2866602 [Favolaschia claudopus]|uniref:Ubiquitin 3 binding protein But2 C-terminal domain-containing protein n=1 Tax=Favolaschia claudopus TaxID=2862362 RepID=A0AAW0DH74_9AGAR
MSNSPLLRDGVYANDELEDDPILARVDVCDCHVNHSNSKHRPSKSETCLLLLSILACIASLLYTLLNFSLLLNLNLNLSVSNDIKYLDVVLETPNSYYGLQNAYRDPTAPPPPPIHNPAFFAGHINASAPSTVLFKHNPQFTDFGTIYTTDRRFIANPQISTIFQFRVQDWGMEKCNITLSLSPSPLSSHGHSTHSHTRSPASPSPSTPRGKVDIWRLDLNKKLPPSTLSWNTRPRRSSLLTSWDLTAKQRYETPEFKCASGEIITFELACEESCEVDFNQPREGFVTNLFLMQSSSL